jgi:hypothetical protein
VQEDESDEDILVQDMPNEDKMAANRSESVAQDVQMPQHNVRCSKYFTFHDNTSREKKTKGKKR